MAASGFRISWAMFAASCPVAASRSERRSSASMRTTSLTSWKITTCPSDSPLAERRIEPESPSRRSWPRAVAKRHARAERPRAAAGVIARARAPGSTSSRSRP